MNTAAVAYIEDPEGKLLCVWNRRYNGWSLPGGKVEEGETIDAACRRELEEETGMLVRFIDPLYQGEHGIKVEGSRGSYVNIFRVEAFGEPREMEEGCPVRWLTRAEFLASSPFASFYEKVFAAIPPRRACDACGTTLDVLASGLDVEGADWVCSEECLLRPGGENYEDKRARLDMMAKGDPTWDLSPNDVAAVRTILERHDALKSQLAKARALIAAFRAERRALLEWMDGNAESWGRAEGAVNQAIGSAWRVAHDGIRDGDYRGGMASAHSFVLQANPPPETLDCDHCGSEALESTNGFLDGTSGPCMTCSFPGHVVVDEGLDDEPASARWQPDEDPAARCKDKACGECCDDCKSATGGVCSKHAWPEPVEY